MRYFLLIVAFLLPSTALAITGDSARFDWSRGAPAVVDDTTNACNDTATVRYEWYEGSPAPTFDSTANCTSVAPPAGGEVIRESLWDDE